MRYLWIAGALMVAAPVAAQQCDSTTVAFIRKQTDSIRFTTTGLTRSPAYLQRAASRIDSTVQRRCLTAVAPIPVPPPDTTTPPPPPPPPPPTPTPTPTPAPSGAPSIMPTLPLSVPNTAWPTVTRTLTVSATGNLQAAIDSARRGDEIVLAAGAIYAGRYAIRPKAGACTDYIIIRTSALANLPQLGGRVQLSDAVHMPKIVGQDVVTPLETEIGACGWRFVGIEVTVSPTVAAMPTTSVQQGLVYLGSPYTLDTLRQGSHFILDRVYIHGQPKTNSTRCVLLSASHVAIIGSQLRECHGKAFDSQAIASNRSPGPILIENNRLEAAGEIIIFGGDLPPNGMVGHDITIRRNYMGRPLAWMNVWTVKNIFELKNAKRVLVEQNVMENHWCCGQQGPAIMLGTLDNPCSWCIVSDVTFRWNQIENVHSGFNLIDKYGNALPMVRVAIYQNLVTGVGNPALNEVPNGNRRLCFLLQQGVHDLYIANNTCGGPYSLTWWLGIDGTLTNPKQRFTFRANVMSATAGYPTWGPAGVGNGLLNMLVAPFAVDSNVWVAPSDAAIVTGNGNIRLTAPGLAPAGRGVDQVALAAKVSGVR